jgi:hypothetical protein
MILAKTIKTLPRPCWLATIFAHLPMVKARPGVSVPSASTPRGKQRNGNDIE